MFAYKKIRFVDQKPSWITLNTMGEILDRSCLSKNAQLLLDQEHKLSYEVETDQTIRAKIIDQCGFSCQFCHNEGTPVNNKQSNQRVSIFVPLNKVSFIPGRMEPDKKYIQALLIMKNKLKLNELHLTGGEPTLHPRLSVLIKIASELGYNVKMTSNGEIGSRLWPELFRNGLSSVNFSIFGTSYEEFIATQRNYCSESKAKLKLQKLDLAIIAARQAGISVKANVVLPNESHFQRVQKVILKYGDVAEIRILHELGSAHTESAASVYELLAKMKAIPISRKVTAATSKSLTKYQLPNGFIVGFKQIRPCRLPGICDKCLFNNPNDCPEGYYGVRLYVDQQGSYKVGLCILRMDLVEDLEHFSISSNTSAQIINFKQQDEMRLKCLLQTQAIRQNYT